MIIGVVCTDQNYGIGKTNKETGKGELLFKLKKDMEFFQDITKEAGFVVFGENTYLSLPKRPLKDRVNIVLCPEGREYEGCICFHDFDKLLAFVQIVAKRFNVCICGGAMLYVSFLKYYDEININKVFADGNAEVFFPNIDKHPEFEIVHKPRPVEDNGYMTQLFVYRRKVFEDGALINDE